MQQQHWHGQTQNWNGPAVPRRVTPRPPVPPPNEADTVTDPVSVRRALASHQGYDIHPGFVNGADSDRSGYRPAPGPVSRPAPYPVASPRPTGPLPAVPPGATFVAATPAAMLGEVTPAEGIRTPANGTPTRGGAHRGKPGTPVPRDGAQRQPGAHRAPAGRPGSARAKLAVASTASLAGLSALVGTAVLATDTGPLLIPSGPGDTATTENYTASPAALHGGGTLGDTAPATPQLAPAAPGQSTAQGSAPSTGSTVDAAANAYASASASPYGDSTLDAVIPLTADATPTASATPDLDDVPENSAVGYLPSDLLALLTPTPSATPSDATTSASPSADPSASTTASTSSTSTTAAPTSASASPSATTTTQAAATASVTSQTVDPFSVESVDPATNPIAALVFGWS